MDHNIQVYDLVALLEDIQTEHFKTGQPLLLRRGEVGTVVMIYDNNGFEVEFADDRGRTYALLTITPEKLSLSRRVSE